MQYLECTSTKIICGLNLPYYPLHILAWRIPGMGAWWAAIYGVAQSRTRLKRLSSSSNVGDHFMGFLIRDLKSRKTSCSHFLWAKFKIPCRVILVLGRARGKRETQFFEVSGHNLASVLC